MPLGFDPGEAHQLGRSHEIVLIDGVTTTVKIAHGHLTEFGQIVPQGAANATRLISIAEDPDSSLPTDAIATLKVLGALPQRPRHRRDRPLGLNSTGKGEVTPHA